MEGKAVCRQNALKHGLTGAGVVLHPADREEVRTRLEEWTRDLDAQDSVEAWLIGRAAIASVRLDRCVREERARLEARLDAAGQSWLVNERRIAEKFGVELDHTPVPADPLNVLQARAVGCEWLVAAWDRLELGLLKKGYWDAGERARALRLLGEARPPGRSDATPLAAIWAPMLAAQPALDVEAAERFLGVSHPALPAAERQAEARKHLPPLEQAQQGLRSMVAAERAHWQARAQQLWSEVDAPLRTTALDQHLFDPSDEADRMLRYEKANASEVHRSLGLLFHKRREQSRAARPAAPARPGGQPASGNNGHEAPTAPCEPFVMPRGLADRMSDRLAGAAGSPAPGSENRPTAPAEMVTCADASTGSDDSDRAGAAAPEGIPPGQPGA